MSYRRVSEPFPETVEPFPRAVSNVVNIEFPGDPDLLSRTLSGFAWDFLQFVDHDMTGAVQSEIECPGLDVPECDPCFDPECTGEARIPYCFGVKVEDLPINIPTSWLDASNVYCSDYFIARALRTSVDGKMLMTENTVWGDLLPTVEFTGGDPPFILRTDLLPEGGNYPPFAGGDSRLNEQTTLTVLHTLFVREHNRIIDEVLARHGGRISCDNGVTAQQIDEALYWFARDLANGYQAHILFEESLPLILGPDAIPPYTGYKPEMAPFTNPGVEFNGAGFRIGHTMVNEFTYRLDSNGRSIPAGPLPVADSFFNSSFIWDYGLETYLRGLVGVPSRNFNPNINDALRDHLFGSGEGAVPLIPGVQGLDLASLNIERGRDFLVPRLNGLRKAFGLPPYRSIREISSDPEKVRALEIAYDGQVENVDPWPGMLSEDPYPGAFVGETMRAVMIEQFTANRDGDRFFYKNLDLYEPSFVALVEADTFGDLVKRNTRIGASRFDKESFGGARNINELTPACIPPTESCGIDPVNCPCGYEQANGQCAN